MISHEEENVNDISKSTLTLPTEACRGEETTSFSPPNQIGQVVRVPLLEGLSCRSSTAGPLSGSIDVRLPINERLLVALEAHRHQHPEGTFVAYLGVHATVDWVAGTGGARSTEAGML